MASILPLISNSSTLFANLLVTVPSAQTTTGITVKFMLYSILALGQIPGILSLSLSLSLSLISLSLSLSLSLCYQTILIVFTPLDVWNIHCAKNSLKKITHNLKWKQDELKK